VSINVDSIGDLRRITLDNGVVRAAVLPELGGKMISLVRQAIGREFVLPPMRSYRRAAYRAAFEEFDTSGFDECLPTVKECPCPDGALREQQLPDHGEVWSVPWQYDIAGEELLLSVRGSLLPYAFDKRLRLTGNVLVIEYEIRNRSEGAFPYLWSAHPLLQVEPGACVLLPDDVRELMIYWSNRERLGIPGESCAYPLVSNHNGRTKDLSIIKRRSARTAEKLFTPRLHTGFCGLRFPGDGESIAFRFDAEAIPYIGLWLCQGGWPSGGKEKHFTVGLEPCNGRSDWLAKATRRGECPVLDAGACRRWTLSIELCNGVPNPKSRPDL
jgi:hypothetical protein